jgi:hypothetical protein
MTPGPQTSEYRLTLWAIGSGLALVVVGFVLCAFAVLRGALWVAPVVLGLGVAQKMFAHAVYSRARAHVKVGTPAPFVPPVPPSQRVV